MNTISHVEWSGTHINIIHEGNQDDNFAIADNLSTPGKLTTKKSSHSYQSLVYQQYICNGVNFYFMPYMIMKSQMME
jgi:hypothetical protein